MCQVCYGHKKLPCVLPIQRNPAVCSVAHPAFEPRCVYAHARMSVREFLWQSTECLAGVTWGGRWSLSLCIQSKTLIVTFSPIKGVKWKPDVEWNLVAMRAVFLQIPLFCSLATVRVQTGSRNTRTIYTIKKARTAEKKRRGPVSLGQANAAQPDPANCLLLGT